jgi:hypothetical protein
LKPNTLEKWLHIKDETQHEKKLLLITGFMQLFIQNEIQKQNPSTRNCKVYRRGVSKEGK